MSSDQDKDKDNSSHVSGILRPLLNRVGSIAHHVGLVRRPDSPRLTRKPDDNEALEKVGIACLSHGSQFNVCRPKKTYAMQSACLCHCQS